MTHEEEPHSIINREQPGGGGLPTIDFETLKAQIKSQPAPLSGRRPEAIKPSRPQRAKIVATARLISQLFPADRINTRTVSIDRINVLLEIARLAGEKPDGWQKPAYGSFDYCLGRKCGWISDEESRIDTQNYEARRKRALGTSHRFSSSRYGWDARPRYEVEEARDYVPQVSMKVVNDRNLTDSARRIVMFIMRHAYQDARSERFIGMTVTFIMEGLALSRRTVQRCLTLLETLGYLRCEVATAGETKMCIGLIIKLLSPLFPEHHKKSWPETRKKSGASSVSEKQSEYLKTSKGISNGAVHRILRLSWALKCMAGVARSAYKAAPERPPSSIPQCRGFRATPYFHPDVESLALQPNLN